MTSPPDKKRRAGYAPAANGDVGRRGLHTRDRILACAADVFLANGFHGTSLDAIAKAAKSSRATVYQYFAGKEEIFRELSTAAERAVLDHGDSLGALGPTSDGVAALHRWLAEWADVYDVHAAAFAEYPGIGTELSVGDTHAVAETFAEKVTARVRTAGVDGLDPDSASAALVRIPHMVHLYRYRSMFPLPDRDVVTSSLTVALQLMLFPDTPDDALNAITSRPSEGSPGALPGGAPPEATPATTLSPIALDVLSASSSLFAEHGYHGVGMEQIAAAAQLSRATLYRYFSTKVEILAELTHLAVAEIEIRAAALPAMDAASLTPWMLGYVTFHRTYRGVIRAWLDGTVAEQLSDASVGHGIGAIHQAVLTMLCTANLPAQLDVRVASAVFLAVLGRMTEPTSRDEAANDERAAELMVTLLRRSFARLR
ncbi:TetR/AcrR family transcriptional regulator [Mycolicibacterium sp.]|uniref:TetR/AcrR family transcriptional regulator n=1 Tax=Mycolicibacterium sp. TaxID=2320850 RepID=UPI001A22EB12|nr:TetR/AcrR family transcriptional regulator [Mycolicibacterium sp.]MBJ7336460.1 TetR/AcrR family transcriptional regulator [Mycolicibacterium sp.]